MTSESKPKVVYVLGAGRSGSTILGIALGNCEQIFYAGELHLWLARNGKSPLRGEQRASFWGAVRARVTVAPELLGRATRPIEQSAALLRPNTWRTQRRLRRGYRRATEKIFGATAAVADATHVVDTSHFPRRARELQKLDGIELYVLFVVRDPESVVASYARDDKVFARFNTMTTNGYLWLTYLLSLNVFLRQPRARRLLVRHETFVTEPEGVLRAILDCVGSPAALPDLSALRTGVAFQGNPVLGNDVVALKRKPAYPSRGSRLTAILQRPWVKIFARLTPEALPPSRSPAQAD